MNEAIYAGDAYSVKLHGLLPYDEELEFLPWEHVEPRYVYPEKTSTKTAAFVHPPGTSLHLNTPLASRVEEHFKSVGTTVGDVAGSYEDICRTADPWNVTYGQGWYEHEAGSAVGRLRRQGYTRHEAAHLIADLSPQNPWYGTENHPELGNREEAVRFGRQVKNMRNGVGKYEGHVLTVSDDEASVAHEKWKDTARLQPGRYDISHPDPSQWGIGPREMAELPQFHSRATRGVRAAGIATALGIRSHDELGPKTYPFHDNINEPHSSQLFTGDTWMVKSGGITIPRSQVSSFLSSKGGRAGEAKNIPIYKGYGQVGLASAAIGATRNLNRKPPEWNKGALPLNPMHVQAIVWNEYQSRVNPKFKKGMETLRDRPWDKVFGYNFDAPHAV